MFHKHILTHFQLVDVLRTRNNKAPMFQSSHIKADEVQDGTFEEIILDMKKKPFRAEQNGGPAGTDHMRKSIRKVNGRDLMTQFMTPKTYTGFSSKGRAKLRVFRGKTAWKSTQPSTSGPSLTRNPCT